MHARQPVPIEPVLLTIGQRPDGSIFLCRKILSPLPSTVRGAGFPFSPQAGSTTRPLPPHRISLEAHLAAFAQPGADGLVFTGEKGGPLRDHVWQAKWSEARASVGLPKLHFHDLRHVANTLTAAAGASTRDLMHRMGHVSPAAALRYQHATRDRDVAIAAALGDLIAPNPATVTQLRPRAGGNQ